MSTSVLSSASASASGTSSAVAAASSSGADLKFAVPNSNIIGISLAVGSGLFIGASFVIKKKGLLQSTAKYGNELGEGHGYLKSWLWWTGMIMMIVGEICNFVAYAFTVAVLVTPMGSVSVVVAAILSHFFLAESLTFFGWIGCSLCILGSIILALNAPKEQSVHTIPEFLKYFVAPGFLVWMSLLFAISIGIVFYAVPRWGKKNMMSYISICSLIGGISVSCTQGLGAAIVTSFQGHSQIKHWFFWFLLVFCIVTLLIEINYLNKALELFNTSMVVPVYFCYFTSATMITSFILYRGLKAPAIALVTMVLGFFVICLGITLLQMSKVDPKQLQGLDRRSTLLLQASRQKTEAEEKGDVTSHEEPGIDALRGGFSAAGSIIRARSIGRRKSSATSGFSVRTSGVEHYGHQPNLNTHGMAHLPRYQLSDNPMSDELSHLTSPLDDSPASPMATRSLPQVPVPKRSTSTIKFDDSDIVHQYGYSHQDMHSTTVVPHEDLHEDGSSRHFPSVVQREKIYENPYEEAEERRQQSKTNFGQLLGTFTHSMTPQPRSPTAAAAHGFPLNFPISVPGRGHSHDNQVRGGTARGTRDYPHLPKEHQETERQERAKLVESPVSDREDAPELGDLSAGGLRSADAPSPARSPIYGLPSPRSDSPRRPMGPR